MIDIALGPEHAEALALGGQGLLPIQGHELEELERSRIIFRCHEGRSEPKSIGGPQRMCFDDPLRLTSHELDGGDFRLV